MQITTPSHVLQKFSLSIFSPICQMQKVQLFELKIQFTFLVLLNPLSPSPTLCWQALFQMKSVLSTDPTSLRAFRTTQQTSRHSHEPQASRPLLRSVTTWQGICEPSFTHQDFSTGLYCSDAHTQKKIPKGKANELKIIQQRNSRANFSTDHCYGFRNHIGPKLGTLRRGVDQSKRSWPALTAWLGTAVKLIPQNSVRASSCEPSLEKSFKSPQQAGDKPAV